MLGARARAAAMDGLARRLDTPARKRRAACLVTIADAVRLLRAAPAATRRALTA